MDSTFSKSADVATCEAIVVVWNGNLEGVAVQSLLEVEGKHDLQAFTSCIDWELQLHMVARSELIVTGSAAGQR
ncbi:MAG: hypothetical protein GEU83_17360 [Pseudonocardiaceae bacterium]|nr:hypothetical protein [Pseudonocardiaceae bacterium]